MAGSCKKSGGSGSPDCDTEIRYDARKVAGRVNVAKFGVEAESSVAAVREVDSAVERYSSGWRSLCMDYKNGATTPEEYRSEFRALRERMEKLEAMLLVLEHAPDADSYQKALKEIYVSMVPAEQAVDLKVDFGVLALPAGFSPTAPGLALPVGAAKALLTPDRPASQAAWGAAIQLRA